MTTYIIAELGVGHDGSLVRALGMVETAARYGANAVKTQFWSSTLAMRKRMHSETDVITNEHLDQIRTQAEWLPILSNAAHERHMDFLCTVDLLEDIPVVAEYVDRFKIASWGATDRAFITAHKIWGKPIIVSLGTVTAEELQKVRRYVLRPMDWLLHCVSAYPTPLTEMNLKVIQTEFLDGLSDHSGKTITGALAVAVGAHVLEVHVRADDTPMDNPEYPHSLSPDDFRVYAGLARTAEKMLGDGNKRLMPSERFNRRYRYVP